MVGEIIHLRCIGVVGTARPQRAGKAVLSHKGGACHAGEAAGRQQLAQLHQRVVIVPVAVADHGHCQRAIALNRSDVLDEQVGHPAGVHGGAEDHQVSLAELLRFPADLGKGEVEGLQGCAGLVSQAAGNSGDHLLGGVGGAEIGGPHGLDFHGLLPLSVVFGFLLPL